MVLVNIFFFVVCLIHKSFFFSTADLLDMVVGAFFYFNYVGSFQVSPRSSAFDGSL